MWLPLSSRTGTGCALAQHVVGEQLEPWPGGVDQDAGGRDIAPAAHLEHEPPVLAAFRAHAARAGADHGAALGGIDAR